MTCVCAKHFSSVKRRRLTLIGEAFQSFNIANLSGRSGDLLDPGFGQPTSRVTQVFGSSGPRGRFSWRRGSVSNQDLLENIELRVRDR